MLKGFFFSSFSKTPQKYEAPVLKVLLVLFLQEVMENTLMMIILPFFPLGRMSWLLVEWRACLMFPTR